MWQTTLAEYSQQCSKSDLAFFDLLKSIAELSACENRLTTLEIEQIEVGARVLNGLIARHTANGSTHLLS